MISKNGPCHLPSASGAYAVKGLTLCPAPPLGEAVPYDNFEVLSTAQSPQRPISGPTTGRTQARVLLRELDTVILEHDADVDVDEAIRRVHTLRTARAEGRDVNFDDMVTFTKTSTDNEVEFLMDRDYFERGLFYEIDQAQKSIHFAMLIWEGGTVGTSLANRLIAKKKQHDAKKEKVLARNEVAQAQGRPRLQVPDFRIRVILDAAMSDLWKLSSAGRSARANVRAMKDAGIDVCESNLFLNGLEHRKMLIVDNDVGIIGGTCAARNYYCSKKYDRLYRRALKKGWKGDGKALEKFVNKRAVSKEEDPKLWKLMHLPEAHDLSWRFRGTSVKYLQASFLQSWLYQESKPLEKGLAAPAFTKKYFEPLTDSQRAQKYFDGCGGAAGVVRPNYAPKTTVKIANGVPHGGSEIGAYMLEVIEGAKKTLDINMSYVMVGEFVDALIAAARRGTKVRLISNSYDSIDIKVSFLPFFAELGRILEEENIEVYLLHDYSHVKLMIADDRLVLGATGNPEYNSWERGWDQIVLMDFGSEDSGQTIVRSLKTNLIEGDMVSERSSSFTLKDYKNLPWAAHCGAKVLAGLFHCVMPIGGRDRLGPIDRV